MKVLIVCLVLVASALSATLNKPPSNKEEEPIPIVSQEQEVSGYEGSYKYSYETGNGIKLDSAGSLKELDKENKAQVDVGSYEYTAPDGQLIKVTYVADENGFVPQGAHFPQAPSPPEIPPAIARALEWIAAHPQPEEESPKKKN